MIIKDFACTGDFHLDYILKRMYKAEMREGYNISKLNYEEFNSKEPRLEYVPHYTSNFQNDYSLFTLVDHENKTIYIFIDVED